MCTVGDHVSVRYTCDFQYVGCMAGGCCRDRDTDSVKEERTNLNCWQYEEKVTLAQQQSLIKTYLYTMHTNRLSSSMMAGALP